MSESEFVRYIVNKSIKVNALLNIVRQSLSVIFPLITFPYVSRILGSEEYGKYTFSSSIVSYFSLIASFGISSYAIREGARVRDNKDEINMLSSDLFTVNIITSLISYAFLFGLIIFNSKLKSYRYLIVIQGMCIFLSTVGVDWINTIYEDFFYITIRYIVIQIIALFLVFLTVNEKGDTWIYSLILVFASYGGNIINIFYIRKYVSVRLNLGVRLKKYILPLSVLCINSLATVIYVNSDITMLGFFNDNTNVGIYSFSSKIYNIIKYFINAVMIVLVPRLAYYRDKDEGIYQKYVNQLLEIILLIVCPFATGVFVLSKDLIMVAGGSEYISGDTSLKILALSLIFALMASVFTNCILLINRLEKRCLVATLSSALVNVILNILLIPHYGIEGAAVTTVIAEALSMLIQWIYSKKDLNISIKFHIRIILTAMMGCFIVWLCCILFKNLINSDDIMGAICTIVLSFLLSCIGYIIIMYFFQTEVIFEFIFGKKVRR